MKTLPFTKISPEIQLINDYLKENLDQFFNQPLTGQSKSSIKKLIEKKLETVFPKEYMPEVVVHEFSNGNIDIEYQMTHPAQQNVKTSFGLLDVKMPTDLPMKFDPPTKLPFVEPQTISSASLVKLPIFKDSLERQTIKEIRQIVDDVMMNCGLFSLKDTLDIYNGYLFSPHKTELTKIIAYNPLDYVTILLVEGKPLSILYFLNGELWSFCEYYSKLGYNPNFTNNLILGKNISLQKLIEENVEDYLSMKNNIPQMDNSYKKTCVLCGHEMLKRSGTYGEFYACSQWGTTGCEGKANTSGKLSPKVYSAYLKKVASTKESVNLESSENGTTNTVATSQLKTAKQKTIKHQPKLKIPDRLMGVELE